MKKAFSLFKNNNIRIHFPYILYIVIIIHKMADGPHHSPSNFFFSPFVNLIFPVRRTESAARMSLDKS